MWPGAGLGLERAVAITFIGEGVSAFLVRSLIADLLPPHQHPDGGSPGADRGRTLTPPWAPQAFAAGGRQAVLRAHQGGGSGGGVR